MIRSYRGNKPIIGQGVYIDTTALVIGDVTIGDWSSLWPMTVVRGDIHRITIGSRTNIQDGSILHVTSPSSSVPSGRSLHIGDGVTVGHGVILHACSVGDHCLIGMGSILLDGVIVEPHVMIGAGSLVPPGKKLTGGRLWLGNPVRNSRQLTNDEIALIEHTATHYVDVAEFHLQERGKSDF